MKNRIVFYQSIFIILLALVSCNSKYGSSESKKENQILTIEPYATLPKNGFNKSALDHNGNMWFTSNGDGVYRYNKNGFTQFTTKSGLNSNHIFSIEVDKKGIVWFGTSNGLCKYDEQKFTSINIPFSDTSSVWLDRVYPIINPNAVHSILETKKGNFWIGTGGNGAYLYNGKTFTSYLTKIGHKQEDNEHHNWITSIAEDDNGHIWFSSMTRGGAIKYDGKTFEQFLPKDGLFTDMVRTIYPDNLGNIWFGYKATHDGGLTKYDGETFTNYNKSDGLNIHSVLTFFEDKKGNIWLGGNLNTLTIYNGKTFEYFTDKQDKTYSDIFFITEDSEKNIWFGGKNGLWKYDGNTVLSFSK